LQTTNRRELLYLFALAVLSTILTIILNPGDPTGPDIHSYVPIADQIIDNPDYLISPEAFQGNFWSMGYPTLLAGMLFVTGSLTGVTVIQACMIGSLVFVPWLLTRHIPGPTRLIAPAITAITPALWGIGTSIAYEAPYAVVLGYSLALAWTIRQRPPRNVGILLLLSALSGFLIALGVLIQSKTLIVVPVIAVLLTRVYRRALWAGIAGFLVPLIPWSIRNFFVLGTINPLAENGPFNVWVGNNPVTTTGGSMLKPPAVPAGATPMQAAIDFIVSQPERAVELVILKSARLTQPVFIFPEILQPGPSRTLLHLIMAVINVLVVLGVVFYLGARLVNGPRGLPALTAPAIFIAVFFAVHLPFIAEPRYMAPVLPVSIGIAVATWVHIGTRWSVQRQKME